MHANRNVTVCLTSLLLAACMRATDSADAASGRDTAGPAVTIDTAAVPARYSAQLPATAAAMQAWTRDRDDAPPIGHVVDNLVLGQSAMFERLDRAAAAVPPADAEAWAARWRELLRFNTPQPAFCALARPVIAGPAGALRLALVATYAESCAQDAELPLVIRADTPATAVLAFYDPWRDGDGARPFDPRLVDAAREVILDADDHRARVAAFTVVAQDDPRALAGLLRIHAEIADRARADEVAMAFADTVDDQARQRAAAACARRPHDPVCDKETQARLTAWIAEAAAAGSAGPPGTSPDEPADAPADAAAIAARIDQLAALGFPKVAAMDRTLPGSDDPREILTLAGAAYWFDVETGQFPNAHDSLLRTLAALASPVFDDVVFAEEAPVLDEDTGEETGAYELIAWADGRRLRTPAENLGDWYDVDAVLRLLNAVAGQRRADLRFMTLATNDQMTVVVAAPPAALRAGLGAGAIEAGSADDAERAGKDFEAEVLRDLQD